MMKTKTKLPKSMKIDNAKKICELYSKGEFTIAALCDAIGIKYETFRQWAQPNLTENDIKIGNYRRGFVHVVHDLYKSALSANRANYKTLLKNVVREGMLKRAKGITCTETHTTAVIDLMGNSTGVMIKKVEKYIPPDTALLIFIAKSIDPLFIIDQTVNQNFTNIKDSLKYLTNEQLKIKLIEADI
jgi:hypothetical protein